MVCCCHLELNLALIIFSDRFSHSSRHTCIRSSGLPIGSHGIVGWRAQKKWASTSPYWITSSGLASGVSREELPFELNCKCRNKEKPNQRYFKGKLSFYYFLATSRFEAAECSRFEMPRV